MTRASSARITVLTGTSERIKPDMFGWARNPRLWLPIWLVLAWVGGTEVSPGPRITIIRAQLGQQTVDAIVNAAPSIRDLAEGSDVADLPAGDGLPGCFLPVCMSTQQRRAARALSAAEDREVRGVRLIDYPDSQRAEAVSACNARFGEMERVLWYLSVNSRAALLAGESSPVLEALRHSTAPDTQRAMSARSLRDMSMVDNRAGAEGRLP